MAQLDIGVGINSGDMIAGNIGSSSIMSYTVIGDNVNLGARLESLNKDYKTRIIISDATRTRLTGQYDIRPLGDVVVKGKTKPVAIFEVRVPAPIQELTTAHMKKTIVLAAALFCLTSVAPPPTRHAQLGRLTQGIGKAKDAVDTANKIADLKMSDKEERQLGEAVSEKLRHGLRRLPERGRHEVRLAGRERARAGEHAPRSRLAVHRPRHRRRQRVRGARRPGAHHARARSG